MPTVELGDMLGHARCHGYAVGAFTVPGLEIARGILTAAERARAPVVLVVDPAADEPAALESQLAGLVAATEASTIPAALLWGPVGEAAEVHRAARLGCGGVLAAPRENAFAPAVNAVRDLVSAAATCRLTVVTTPLADESGRTPAAEAAALAERTRSDALQVAINTPGKGARSRLDYNRLRQIHEASDRPLAVTADAGTGDDQIRRMVAQGVAQVGFAEGVARAATEALRNADPTLDALSRTVRSAVAAWSGDRMRATGSAGRAAEVLSRCRERTAVEELLIQEAADAPAVERALRAGGEILRGAPGVRAVHGYRTTDEGGSPRAVWRVELCHPAARQEFADHLPQLPGGPVRHLPLEASSACMPDLEAPMGELRPTGSHG
ncbi:MAG: class II fructose-bisphosphate aldolase [Pseudomonadota bacterium]